MFFDDEEVKKTQFSAPPVQEEESLLKALTQREKRIDLHSIYL